ncbi:hypothetical protein B0H13DRAFT_2316642 [Mycena leptocephala]|nr:hypothetical protein B0H13DRAFT_2316642 [Mycena leptocephala]
MKAAMLSAQQPRHAAQPLAGSDLEIISLSPTHPTSPMNLDESSAPPSPTVPPTWPASASPKATDTEFFLPSEPVSSAAVSDSEDFPPISGVPSETEGDPPEEELSAEQEDQEQRGEAWEDELEERLSGTTGALRDWGEIRTKIKAELKKNSKILPLSRINQLMIVSNFATL